jgi:gliding motility-associated-like protein
MKKIILQVIHSKLILILFVLTISTQSKAQNLLTNGGFENGGSGTGFLVTDYTLINPLNGISNPGNYAVTTNPTLMNTNFIPGGDHTTGSGKMLIIDGATAANKFFWTTGSTGGAIGGFTIGTTYTFSYWVKSVSNEVTSSTTQSNIGAFFVNASNINPVSLSALAPLPAQGWKNVSYSFVANATVVLIRLRTINAGALGNDFAVDDFSITAGGLPIVGTYTSANPSCPNINDGSILFSAVGGALPYSAFTLSGTSTASNTNGIFSNLAPGTYTISFTDAAGTVFSESGIVLAAPSDITISVPTTICVGDSTTLSVSGSPSGYTWTASPADASLTTPNSANPIVSPLVTTTYTVNSGTITSPTNLVFNGDFSIGNIGFTTNYIQVANPNPFGVQGAYDIVSNSNSWFVGFTSCTDHTSGSGNMLVADGSANNSGNDSVWCNQIPIDVTPGTDYIFEYYIQTVASGTPAQMEVIINGVSLGLPTNAPALTCLWAQRTYTWNSGTSTTANICIYDREVAGSGNDFALDDISLKEAPVCFYEKSVTITVTQKTTPTFTQVAAVCLGEIIPALTTSSIEGISGTWLPAINNATTTEYTFTPATGECANTATMTIVVTPKTTPTFTQVAAVCLGEIIPALTTSSIEGISGTWLPAINNATTTEYTFTPATGECANTTTMTIVVTPKTTPTFTQVAAICLGEIIPALTTSSIEGISGTWSPAINNATTTEYTFTPATGECAIPTTMTIDVKETPEFTISEGCNGFNYTLTMEHQYTNSPSFTWFNSDLEVIGNDETITITEDGIYYAELAVNGCSIQNPITVTEAFCTIQKGISPNDDGSNDSFDLSNLNVKQLQIFNRHGIEVYSRNNYTNEWYGTSNDGKELPDATYYYVINFESGKSRTGWIYINREN